MVALADCTKALYMHISGLQQHSETTVRQAWARLSHLLEDAQDYAIRCNDHPFNCDGVVRQSIVPYHSNEFKPNSIRNP